MPIFLVRHAKAGKRSEWNDDDSIRPLDEKGWAQANAIGVRIAALSPSSLVSSPFLRCSQTLEPLATLTGLSVRTDKRLAEVSTLRNASIGLIRCLKEQLPAVTEMSYLQSSRHSSAVECKLKECVTHARLQCGCWSAKAMYLCVAPFGLRQKLTELFAERGSNFSTN